MKKVTLNVLAGIAALTALGTLGACSSGTSYGVSYRDGYDNGRYYSRHSYRPYYDRYYGPRSSFSFSYRE
jgi:hypothetical protein